MILREIINAVDGNVVCGSDRLDENVDFAFASDLMSDVLTIKKNDFILLTGLANIQTIRTAEMSDLQFILFVRGKAVTEEMKELAEDNGMVVITTRYSLFKSSGLLFAAGIEPVY
ncbi:MAG TPA: hypothetical protein IAC34_03935 [Candidatus Coprenecus stercoripullorum]|nr:hypothetical protein [Candidatus Coprenecus stercoripullorum]